MIYRLRARDTTLAVPAGEVPLMVSDYDLAIKVSLFLTTLAIFDACEHFLSNLPSNYEPDVVF